jgi:hypothetical protein
MARLNSRYLSLSSPTSMAARACAVANSPIREASSSIRASVRAWASAGCLTISGNANRSSVRTARRTSAAIGWNDLVRQVAALAATLPPQQRSRLVVLTGDYGAAGAVDLYGPAYRLPHAISGHNTYWWWGPGGAPDDSTTIAINLPQSQLQQYFHQVRPAGTVLTPHGVWSEERGDPIWICTGQSTPWAQLWPAMRHYG